MPSKCPYRQWIDGAKVVTALPELSSVLVGAEVAARGSCLPANSDGFDLGVRSAPWGQWL